MTLTLPYILWGVVWVLLIAATVTYMGAADDFDGEALLTVILLGWLWPIALAVILVALPFVGIYYGARSAVRIKRKPKTRVVENKNLYNREDLR